MTSIEVPYSIAAALPTLSVMDAYQLVTQASSSRIANVCDPNYTIVARMPKRHLPGSGTFAHGTHAVLRDIGQSYLKASRS